jgi:cyclophilin family peptidyl-prolyl cis-trans isomerase/HEAT repeat protein
MCTLCLLLLFFLGPPDNTPPKQARSAKINTILILQNERQGSDPQLARFLSDRDTVVRERATMACASIQDTNLIPLLLPLLRDNAAHVKVAAAFAIGQTGQFLSPTARAALEKKCLDLIALGGVPPRLTEEMGKFGSASTLSRLAKLADKMKTRPEQDAMVMAIARFAIRGIATNDASQFLINLLASQPPTPSWQTVYAFQRLSPQAKSLVPILVPLTRNQDPLVRMNAALALGKLGDTLGNCAALIRLSSDDRDWRVRVNALRALGMFGSAPRAEVFSLFAAAFSDSNEHVALTAMTMFGEMMKSTGSVPQQAATELWRIAENAGSKVSARRQAEAVTALAKIKGSGTYERLSRIQVPDDWSLARYVVAIGMTGDTLALATLLNATDLQNPLVASAALEGLQHLGLLNAGNKHVTRAAAATAVKALTSRDISVLSAAASLLADSLFPDPEAVPSLIRAMQNLQEPADVEAMQQIIQTLGTLRDKRAIEPLTRKLSSPDRTVAESAATALEAITGRSYLHDIRVNTRPLNMKSDSSFLARLPDTVLVRMQTSAGSVLLELYREAAPFTVMSFLKLAGQQFFDGLKFHRVVPNFVVQGGDPRGDGWGGPGYSIRSEFSLLRYERGMLGMASAGKDTEGSQFFITHSPQPHLDGRYTIFGRVREGMGVIDTLQVGDEIVNVTQETQP